jgi:XTP/dITP diphosphohydrolase
MGERFRPRGSWRTYRRRDERSCARAPRGTNGFGYDPVFVVPSLGKTVAELPPETKQEISHRSVAARRLIETMRSVS